MKPEIVREKVGDVPNMSLEQGKRLADLIEKYQLKSCLELGFFHGVSSAYIAAALQEIGGGKLTTVDLEYTEGLEPNVQSILDNLGLREYVDVCLEPTSYTWRLMHLLEALPQPQFDFCYIDGSHTWAVDGFAFFLVERLLKPGGWIVFDDFDRTYRESIENLAAKRDKLPEKIVDFMLNMPPEEQDTPQVRKVYELLVKSHPSFDYFRQEDGWAYARKTKHESGVAEVRQEVVTVRSGGIAGRIKNYLRKLVG